jgi:hypothetical protein
MSGIAPKQNTFKFKIAQHKQKSIVTFFWQEDAPLPSQRGPGTPQHNGKSGTADTYIWESIQYAKSI